MRWFDATWLHLKKYLYEIIIWDGPKKVYHENFPFGGEPVKDEIIGFMRLIRPEFLMINPEFVFDKIDLFFVMELTGKYL